MVNFGKINFKYVLVQVGSGSLGLEGTLIMFSVPVPVQPTDLVAPLDL